jgi:hypothetical protein
LSQIIFTKTLFIIIRGYSSWRNAL